MFLIYLQNKVEITCEECVVAECQIWVMIPKVQLMVIQIFRPVLIHGLVSPFRDRIKR